MYNVRLADKRGDPGQVFQVASFHDLKKRYPGKFAVDLGSPKKIKNLSAAKFAEIASHDADLIPPENRPQNHPEPNSHVPTSSPEQTAGSVELSSPSGSIATVEKIKPDPALSKIVQAAQNSPPPAQTDPAPAAQPTPLQPRATEDVEFTRALVAHREALDVFAARVTESFSNTAEQQKTILESVLNNLGEILRSPSIEEHARAAVEHEIANISRKADDQVVEVERLREKVQQELRQLRNLEQDVVEDTLDLQRMVEKYRPAQIEILQQKLQIVQDDFDKVAEQRNQLQLRLAAQNLEDGAYDPALYTDVLRRNVEMSKQLADYEETKRQLTHAQRQILDLEPYREAEHQYHKELRELSELRKFKVEHAPQHDEVNEENTRLVEHSRRLSSKVRQLTAALDDLRSKNENLDEIVGERDNLRKSNNELSRQVAQNDSRRSALEYERDGLKALLDEGEEVYRTKVEAEQASHVAQRTQEVTRQLDDTYRREMEQLKNFWSSACNERDQALERVQLYAKDLEQERARADVLHTEFCALEERTDHHKLSSKVKSLQQDKDDLSRMVAEKHQKLEEVLRESAELEGRITALKDERRREEEFQERRESARESKEAQVFKPWADVCPPLQAPTDEWTWLKGIMDQISDSGFKISNRLLLAFHTALKTQGISPLTLLMGISGTGKSELPRLYADCGGLYFLPVAVQPNWDSPMDLFGFFNYADGYFRSTPLSRAMHQFVHDEAVSSLSDRILLVLLDEMNLARVEHYFSDLLSRLESRRSVIDSAQPTLEQLERASIDLDLGTKSMRLPLRRNVLFAGTLNQDESTLEISDKVVDRSNVLTFPRPQVFVSQPKHSDRLGPAERLTFDVWEKWQKPAQGNIEGLQEELQAEFSLINEALARVNRGVGQRVFQAVLSYVSLYPSVPKHIITDTRKAALADQYAMKILPKLKGIDLKSGGGKDCIAGMRKLVPDELRDAFDESTRDHKEMFEWEGSTDLFSDIN